MKVKFSSFFLFQEKVLLIINHQLNYFEIIGHHQNILQSLSNMINILRLFIIILYLYMKEFEHL